MARMTIEEFTRRIETALDSGLVSLVLYGSAAREGAAASMDTLIICDAATPDRLARLAAPVAAWVRAGHPAPLVFGEAEWRESADAFPIEFEDIRAAHQVLAGRDPWAGIRVDPADLRRQLEHELRGKLIRLRQAVLSCGGDRRRLGRAFAGSASGLLAVLRALLRAAGRPVPAERGAVVAAAGALAGFTAEPVTEVVTAAARGRALALGADDARVAACLDAVRRAADFVNALPGRSA